MAKPRFPKNNNDVKETIPNPSSLPSLSEARSEARSDTRSATSVGVAEAPPASAVTESRKTETRKPARKPEIVKAEARANLVPINVEDEIRRLAYLLAERRGFEAGHEAEDWLSAEREIRQRYRQQSA
jgi:hypothetical protein